MSSTSSSWSQLAAARAAGSGALDADVGLLAVVAVPDRAVGGPTTAGGRCTTAGCSPSSPGTRAPWLSGVKRTRPVAHRLDRRLGELVHAHEPLQRDQRLDALARAVRVGHLVRVRLGPRRSAPCALELRDHRRARLLNGHPRESLAAPSRSSGRPRRSPRSRSSPWRRPISKSLGSWPGVIFSAPVPNSGLTYSSAMIGRRAPDQRQDRRRARPGGVALVAGLHRDRGVGQHRLRAHRRDDHRALAVGRAGRRS